MLFEEFYLSGVRLKNRIAVAPMTRTSASPFGYVTEQMIRYYAAYAEGGFSLIITEGTYTDEAYSQGYTNQPGIATEEHMKTWKPLIQAVHERGAKIFVQLMHAGALTQGNRFRSETIAPSAVQPRGKQLTIYGGEGDYRLPRQMTRTEAEDVKSGFVQSACLAVEAGFDGIELHGANGYLLDEFITEYTNVRTDEYGGAVENRVRYPAEVVKAVKEAVKGACPVGIRISQAKVNDSSYKWSGGESDAAVIFAALVEAGADFIHVTEYDALSPAFGEGKSLATCAKEYGHVPVISNGNLEDPERATRILKKGEADIVSLGKGALANMDWPNRVRSGQPLDPYDPDMLQPRATLSNAAAWRARKAGGKGTFYF